MTIAETTPIVDQWIEPLRTRKDDWARMPVARKIAYLTEMRGRIVAVADAWVAAAVHAKGIPAGSPLEAEEWLSGPWALLYALNRYIRTLDDIAAHGRPQTDPARVRTRADGQVVVNVFPNTLYDNLLLSGIRADVWMQPGVTVDTLTETMAVFYKQPNPEGRVALVLGAGNIAAIGPLDVLYKLVADGEVCILKMNPVNDYLGTFLEEVFGTLIKEGYVRVVYGGADIGAALATHPDIDSIHITGSDKTYDAIVFGTGAAGAERKRNDRPFNPKPITSELGNVSPTIVVPGAWSAADLRYQAEHVVTQKMHNGGFNCIASQVLVLPQAWPQREAFVAAIRQVLREVTPREQYYSGTAARRQTFVDAYTDIETFDANDTPRSLIAGLDSANPDEPMFRTEAFCNLLGITNLPGTSAAEFLRNAVAFANDVLWGTLGANIIIHPATRKELGADFEVALAALRYGCIGVNAWTGVGFLLAEATWGAYPGHARNDIQSGAGVIHNAYLFDKAQKSVIYQPFAPAPRSTRQGVFHLLPKPPWFVTNRSAADVARRLVAFEAKPSLAQLPALFYHALRG